MLANRSALVFRSLTMLIGKGYIADGGCDWRIRFASHLAICWRFNEKWTIIANTFVFQRELKYKPATFVQRLDSDYDLVIEHGFHGNCMGTVSKFHRAKTMVSGVGNFNNDHQNVLFQKWQNWENFQNWACCDFWLDTVKRWQVSPHQVIVIVVIKVNSCYRWD